MKQEDFEQFCRDFDAFDFDRYYRDVAGDEYEESYDDTKVIVWMSSDYDPYDDMSAPDEVTYGKVKEISSKDIISDLAGRGIVDSDGKSLVDDYTEEPMIHGVHYFTVVMSTPWERYEIDLKYD